MKRKNQESDFQNDLFPSFGEFKNEVQVPSLISVQKPNDLSFRSEITNYLTHDFHSYPAKFIPQLVTWLLNEYSKPGAVVLDPFVGSGTTMVEAILNDRNCFGVEINPIGRLVSKAKSTPIDSKALFKYRDILYNDIDSELNVFWESSKPNLEIPKYENSDEWFLLPVAQELAIIKKCILSIKNKIFQTLALVAFSSIIKTVSNARTDERIPKLRKNQREKPNTIKIFRNKLDKMISDVADFSKEIKNKKVHAKIIGNDARKIKLKNNTVDLIITSPPYAYAIDYVRMHKLSLYWLGVKDLIKLDKSFVGTERVYSKEYNTDFKYELNDIDKIIQQVSQKDRKKGYKLFQYFKDMNLCFLEMYRVLKPKGIATIVIGNSNVQDVHIPTHELFNIMCKKIGFKIHPPLKREIPYEKKGLANVHMDYGGEMISVEYINVIEK